MFSARKLQLVINRSTSHLHFARSQPRYASNIPKKTDREKAAEIKAELASLTEFNKLEIVGIHSKLQDGPPYQVNQGTLGEVCKKFGTLKKATVQIVLNQAVNRAQKPMEREPLLKLENATERQDFQAYLKEQRMQAMSLLKKANNTNNTTQSTDTKSKES